MSVSLKVLADGRLMGEVVQQADRLSFCYEENWRTDKSAFPLSLSMPLVVPEHGHSVVEAFLWGLLPDNDAVLTRWGRRFRVSPRNPFRLIEHVGEDCAGAVQFVRPDRLEALLAAGPGINITWLAAAELEARIAAVVEDASATRLGTDTGQFSLAGAQPKLALYYDALQDRWGVPAGRTPTTHILKPATGAYDGQAENEHFCLRLAAALGFPTAHSVVKILDGIPVIIIERYDRLLERGVMRRIHQEDFCQAAGIRPQLKYQNKGGPSPRAICEILRNASSSAENDVRRFVDSLIFHWLIAAPDAHAKNYSVLLAAQSSVRLSPLYDLASALPYPRQIPPGKATLAMKIGSHYEILRIRREDWEKLARELRLSSAEVLDRAVEMAARIPEKAVEVGQELAAAGVTHSVVARLVEGMREHALRCAEILRAGGPAR